MSEIRVRNDTGQTLDDVRLTPADGRQEAVSLGPLPPGSVSDWVSVSIVQRYPAIEASSLDTDLVHLPYDGTAQAALAEGRYTYVLLLESGRLAVELEIEQTA